MKSKFLNPAILVTLFGTMLSSVAFGPVGLIGVAAGLIFYMGWLRKHQS